MGADESTPHLLFNRFANAVGPDHGRADRDRCTCVGHSTTTRPASVSFHPERQDVDAPGWRRLLALIDEAAADGRTTFKPFVDMSAAQRRQVVTLPPAIAKLTAVERLVLYGTNLVRLPPAIGGMRSLRIFEPYTSHRLHWYPYELRRCASLVESTVSTRVLYGNVKFRPPFPSLQPATAVDQLNLATLDPGVWGADSVTTCSVCDDPIDDELRQVWISSQIGTDVLPLLVNACSQACIAALPPPHAGYVPVPHKGGPDLSQPAGRG